MPDIDDATLAQWETCRYRVLLAAAAIARRAQGQQPRAPVTSSRQIAATLDVSAATVDRAKRFLTTAGIIAKGDDNRYYTTEAAATGATGRVQDNRRSESPE
jgi:DNA-binding transcriptional regulator YhcF (GntR family)